MRMICPNCGAQYEVDDAVIPEQGRDVQCSNCGHTWFQQPAHRDAELADELEEEPVESEAEEPDADGDASDEATKPGRTGLDPAIADVLREEAEHEAEARQAEADGGLETQPDLGLDETSRAAADRSAAARARMARLRGMEDGNGDAEAAALAAATGPRRDLLPDIEEINSTLRAAEDRDEAADATAPESEETAAKTRKGGSRLLSRLIILGVLVAVVVYLLAPRIIDAVPQSEPYIVAYVEWANAFRAKVNELVGQGIDWVKGMIGQSGDGAAPTE